MSVIVGDVNVVDALLFGGPSVTMREQIAQEHQSFIKSIDPSWGTALIQRTRDLFDSYNGAGVMQMVQNALNHVVAVSRPDAIFEFSKIEEFQTAQPVMQAYLMANPVARDMYHRNLCDGYSDTYVDPKPGVIGFGHDHYEHVMNGIVVLPKEKDGDVTWTNYSSAWATETSEMLNITKKAAMHNSWNALERLFAEGDRDPLSPWNAGL